MKIYHNPRWSKSRSTLKILQSEGVDLEIIEYLKTPFTSSELKIILNKLRKKPHDIIRKGNSVYKSLNIGKDTEDNKVLSLLIEYPELIERPIIVSNEKAVIGRPPENVFELL